MIYGSEFMHNKAQCHANNKNGDIVHISAEIFSIRTEARSAVLYVTLTFEISATYDL